MGARRKIHRGEGPPPPPCTATPPKRRRSRVITEEALYASAARLFFANGYSATSLDQIATEVGVHKSTIFYYVTSKSELLAKVLESGFRDYVQSLRAIAALDVDAATRLSSGLKNHLTFVFEHGAELQIYLRERRHLRDPEGRAYVEMAEQYQTIFTRFVASAMADGVLPTGDPTVTTLLLLGSANSITEWFRADGTVPAQVVAEQWLRLLLPAPSVGRPDLVSLRQPWPS